MPKTKEQKRIEAEERRAAFEKRTPQQQLALIAKRPGKSQREADKLTGRAS